MSHKTKRCLNNNLLNTTGTVTCRGCSLGKSIGKMVLTLPPCSDLLSHCTVYRQRLARGWSITSSKLCSAASVQLGLDVSSNAVQDIPCSWWSNVKVYFKAQQLVSCSSCLRRTTGDAYGDYIRPLQAKMQASAMSQQHTIMSDMLYTTGHQSWGMRGTGATGYHNYARCALHFNTCMSEMGSTIVLMKRLANTQTGCNQRVTACPVIVAATYWGNNWWQVLVITQVQGTLSYRAGCSLTQVLSL